MIAMPLARGVKQRSKQGYISLRGKMTHARSYRWYRPGGGSWRVIRYVDRQGTMLQMLLQDRGGRRVPRKRHDEVVLR